MSLINPDVTPEKDFPLRDDIRLLGRILGDTIREQEGEAVFDIVERIRQTSIRFHRDEDEIARRELETILNSLSRGRTNQIIRAFSYFSHLANIAEDQHHVRRSRAHAMAGFSHGGCGATRGNAGAGPQAHPGGGHQPHRAAGLLRLRPGLPGADRASDGGAPQEHHRPRDGDLPGCWRERDRQRLTPEEEVALRGSAAPRGAHAVADEHPAPEPG